MAQKTQKIGSGMSDVYTPEQFNKNRLSPYEELAGVTTGQYFNSATGDDGQLKQGFRVDPYNGDALQMIKQQAMSQGPSAWAQMQTQAQQQMQNQASDQAMKQGMQAQSGALSNLARQGGAGGGAAALLARSGAREQFGAQQGIAQQGIQSKLGINATDAQNKQTLLGKLGDVETGANAANAQTQKENLLARNAFDVNRYNQQMAAWGAKETAQGMRSAGGGGKK